MKNRQRILIVEDEPLLALGMQDVLMMSGFEIAGIAGKLDKALKLIEVGNYDAAIVDANLASVSASPAASALATRGLPFLVLSGYSADQLAGNFSGAAKILQKPCASDRLIEALNTILRQPELSA